LKQSPRNKIHKTARQNASNLVPRKFDVLRIHKENVRLTKALAHVQASQAVRKAEFDPQKKAKRPKSANTNSTYRL
jgi:hypothetical protein